MEDKAINFSANTEGCIEISEHVVIALKHSDTSITEGQLVMIGQGEAAGRSGFLGVDGTWGEGLTDTINTDGILEIGASKVDPLVDGVGAVRIGGTTRAIATIQGAIVGGVTGPSTGHGDLTLAGHALSARSTVEDSFSGVVAVRIGSTTFAITSILAVIISRITQPRGGHS